MTIIAAQVDPLRSEGAMLADRLRAAGVTVDRREYAGVTHEFFGADGLIPQAAQAQQYAGERLRAALGGEPAAGAMPPMDMPPPAPPAPGERG